MLDDITLRQKAREAIQSGKLPKRPPQRMWGGPGSGACCIVCGESVLKDELELELEYARDAAAPRGGGYHAHVRCFTAWDSERCDLEAVTRGTAPCGDRTRLTAPPLLRPADAALRPGPDTTLTRRVLPRSSEERKLAGGETDTARSRGPA
jgi:hypothetical protein